MANVIHKERTINIKNSPFYTALWIATSCICFVAFAFTIIVILLPPINSGQLDHVKLFGFYVPEIAIPSLSWTFYVSLSLLIFSLAFSIWILMVDHRTYRFNASAPFIRVSFFALILAILMFLTGIMNSPTFNSNWVSNMIWSHQFNGYHLTGLGIFLLVAMSLYFLYFGYELLVGYTHTILLKSRIRLVNPQDVDVLSHVYATHRDKITLMYSKMFRWRYKFKAHYKFHNQVKHWRLLNKYIIINLAYSLLFTLSIIYWIVFLTVFNDKSPFATQGWFIPTFIFCVFFLFWILFLILNVSYNFKRCRSFDKEVQRKDYLLYGYGSFIPFIGSYAEIKYRKKIAKERKDEIVVRRKHHIVMYAIIRFFNVVILVISGIVTILVAFVASSLLVRYSPIPDTAEPLVVSDNRLIPLRTGYEAMTLKDISNPGNDRVYSALTYNTGFNAYNHNMHFFMDEDGHFLNGQSWAESQAAIKQSLNGVARTLGMYHDTMNQDLFTFNWDDRALDASELSGARDIWQTNFNDQDSLDYGNWDSDNMVYGPTSYGTANIFKDEQGDYQADQTLGTTQGLYDFLSFEELDQDSTRSYYVPEYDTLRATPILMNTYYAKQFQRVSDIYATNYAYNYVVPFVPVPLNQMHGKVMGGQATMSRFTIQNSQRYALTSLGGILGLFQLRRCVSINEIPIVDENNQPIISPTTNLPIHFTYITGHLDAYDNGGTIRRVQLQGINQIFENELFTHDENGNRIGETGNYVLMGADWNLSLPETKGYEGDNTDNDPAIAPWNFKEYKSNANVTDVENQNNWVENEIYNHDKVYKSGDFVTYSLPFEDSDPTHTTLNNVIGLDPTSGGKAVANNSVYSNYPSVDWLDDPIWERGSALYEAIGDVPLDERPVVYDLASSTAKLNSKYWKYALHPHYTNTSITKNVREQYIPIANPNQEILTSQHDNLNNYRAATFYGNHAIPSVRHAGDAYVGSDGMQTLSDLNIFKTNIDGFLASYNVNVEATFAYDNNFVYSDHMPVSIKFTLKSM